MMRGTVAITHPDWYRELRAGVHEEVNFWKPSARQAFHAPRFSPFFFKLPKPYNAICGFGYFAQYSRLPIWLAWEAFGAGNGCASLDELESRIRELREGFGYEAGTLDAQIGCIQIVQPVFFPEEQWVAQPADWPLHGQRPKGYDLTGGEGGRIWRECLDRVRGEVKVIGGRVAEPRYGEPVLVKPRLGQGTFRIAVTDAYQRACAITSEHSLPALDAAHIKPFALGGPHEPLNGVLLRADLHRLFDKGYITITPEHRVEVSGRLKQEYRNGRTYYPMHGALLRLPPASENAPAIELLRWHNESCFVA